MTTINDVTHALNEALAMIDGAEPHPQATSCFAREQGYVVARIESAYRELGPALVAALNGSKS